MKNIIIFCRQEGATGLSYIGECDTEFSARAMADDINCIAEKAMDLGYDVYVYSSQVSHIKATTFFKNLINNKIRVINSYEMINHLSDCCAIVTLGFTAMAGTEHAFMSGTFNHLGWHGYFVNDKPYGEIGISKVFADYYGIPIIMASGCKAFCDEAKEFINSIYTVETKKSKFRNIANCVESDVSHKRLTDTIEKALNNIDKAVIDKVMLPIEVRIDYNRTDFCDDAYRRKNYSYNRISARSIKKKIENIKYITDFYL